MEQNVGEVWIWIKEEWLKIFFKMKWKVEDKRACRLRPVADVENDL
jgi:hypothetical protein